MPAPIVFLASADYARRTGGFVYNMQLLDALKRQGMRVEQLTLETGFPRVPEAERQWLSAALKGLPEDAILLTDHIYLCDLADVFASVTLPVVAIFHHSLVVEHGDHADEQAETLRQAERRAIARSAGILVTSDETARYIAHHYGADGDRVRVAVPGNGIVPRVAVGTRPEPLSILSVGAIIPRKRYDYMLSVAACLKDVDWRWQIAGDPNRYPDHLSALKAAAAAAGLADRFVFLGDVADDDLERLFQESDLYVATSAYEGYGMAVAEAFRHGMPVVTTASGAVSTWAAGGMLAAPADDPAGMADLIRPLLSDRGRLRELADRAWRFGETLPSWEETFDGMDGWLAEVARLSTVDVVRE
ncbi:glycosyltransferase family 4 protein [Rhizobium sp. SL86]|uniref:glycosyltransferase family 4 protein n=1 Tax=Rhizobium sp. SL86 TaxID=2995148 RepID=UPI002276BDE0|nr:glycosyltransferase family 4 protein [Rhizobium sp. SL86]MCY1664357.1 glycosyltransferase family 4 protein [Rhizobium sp. SL86]